MQYTDLTRKELQREYSRLTRKYTDFIRQPVELDLTTEEPLPGCANRRAVKHFGTVLDKKLTIAADAMSVVAGITLVVAAVQFISPRVNTIASIMTFTNNAQTMADLSSAIYGTAALLIAVVLNIIAAFTNVNEQ